MKASTIVNVGSWLLLIPLVVATIAHGLFCYHYRGRFISANAILDPVGFILSYLTPVAAFGIAGMVFLWRHDKAKTRSVVLATTLFLSFTFALVVFGIWCFHRVRDFYFSDLVWWLKPIGILWLSAYAMCLATLRTGFVRKHHRLILFICCTCVLMVLGAVLAWLFVTEDFEFSPVNLFAVIPFAVACASLIRVVFIWKDDHVA